MRRTFYTERMRKLDRSRLLHEVLADAIGLRAHQHDRQRAQSLVLPERAAELETVHAGHHEVDKNQVDIRRAVGLVLLVGVRDLDELVERRLSVDGRDSLEAVALENAAHHLAYGRAVIDDENPCGHGACAAGARR